MGIWIVLKASGVCRPVLLLTSFLHLEDMIPCCAHFSNLKAMCCPGLQQEGGEPPACTSSSTTGSPGALHLPCLPGGHRRGPTAVQFLTECLGSAGMTLKSYSWMEMNWNDGFSEAACVGGAGVKPQWCKFLMTQSAKVIVTWRKLEEVRALLHRCVATVCSWDNEALHTAFKVGWRFLTALKETWRHMPVPSINATSAEKQFAVTQSHCFIFRAN